MDDTAPGIGTMTSSSSRCLASTIIFIVNEECLSKISYTSQYPEIYSLPKSRLILDHGNRKPENVEWVLLPLLSTGCTEAMGYPNNTGTLFTKGRRGLDFGVLYG